MNTKTDPYATKTQKRVDLFLLIFIVVILALLLRPAAKGETPLAMAVVRPFWSTLAIFTSNGPVAAHGTQISMSGGYDQNGAADRVALAALFSAPSSGSSFSPMMVVEERKSRQAVAANYDLGQGAKSFSSPSSLSSETQISGVGSTVLKSNGPSESRGGSDLAGADAKTAPTSLSGAIDARARYAGETDNVTFTRSGGTSRTDRMIASSTANSSLHAESAPTYAIAGSFSSDPFVTKSATESFTPKAISLPNPDQITTQTWNGGGASGNWSDNNNWGGSAPGYGTLTFSGSTRTTNSDDSITSQNQLLWTGSSAWTLNQGGSTALSLFDNGGTQAKIENQSTGLVTINLPITFAATAGAAYGEINAVNGGLTFGTGTLTVSGSQVAGIRMFGGSGGISTTFNNTVSAAGKYFSSSAVGQTINVGGSFTADNFYLMNNGTLNLNSGGTLNSTAVRLGGDFGTTGTQDLTKGSTFQLADTAGGQTFAGAINSVSGNTSGALTVTSLSTSATANTLSGHIALDSNLAINQSLGGTLNITQAKGVDNTTGIDIKGQTLTLGGAGNFSVSGTVYNSTGSGTLAMSGSGVATLASTNTQANTRLNSGVVSVNAQGQLGNSSGTVTLNGGTMRITGGSSFNSGASRSFTVTTSGGTIDTTASTQSIIQGSFTEANGAPAVNKTGSGKLVLQGTTDNVNLGFNVNNGILTLSKISDATHHAIGTLTTVGSGGTLLLGNSTGDQIFDSAGIAMNGGTFNLGGFSEGAAGTTGVGALTLTSNSTFDFGTLGGSNRIQFAGLGTHTSGTLLQVIDWEGTAGSANGSDRLLFAGTLTSFSGLYSQSDVSFNGFTGYGLAQFGAFYEVYGLTPVPEPSTWAAAALALGAVAWTQRRRFRRAAVTV